MKSFKTFIKESTITEPGKNPPGTILILGGSSSSEKFASKLIDYGITIKKGDKIEVVKEIPTSIEVKLGSGVEVFIKFKNDTIKIVGAKSILNQIFNYERGRGKGGVKFEGELADDIETYRCEGNFDNVKHQNTMKELDKFFKTQYNIDISELSNKEFEIVPEGKKNQKRSFKFTGSKFVGENNSGKTLTDITLKIKGKNYFLSLKKSKSYYSANLSMRKYLENDAKTRGEFYHFFGIDPSQMVAFGEMYTLVPSSFRINKNASSNIESVIKESYGSDYILVYQLDSSTTFVKDISKPVVKLKGKPQYLYPDGKKRGYMNIKVQCVVNGLNYEVNLQFRSTQAGVRAPQYLRILMVKK